MSPSVPPASTPTEPFRSQGREPSHRVTIVTQALSHPLFVTVLPVTTFLLTWVWSIIVPNSDWWWIVALSTLTTVILLTFVVAWIVSKLNESVLQALVHDRLSKNEISVRDIHDETCESINRTHRHVVGEIGEMRAHCQTQFQWYFLEEYRNAEFFSLHEVLNLERAKTTGEIWIITDRLVTAFQNAHCASTVSDNLEDGVRYRYYYSPFASGAGDVVTTVRNTFRERLGPQIDELLTFIRVNPEYNAVLRLIKDIIVLDPHDFESRRAFLNVYAQEDFEVAFYRELTQIEIASLLELLEHGQS